MTFLIATKNQNKIYEYRRMFKDLNVDFITENDLDYVFPDVDETGSTFEENARLKAESGYKISLMPTIADDSGMQVDALNGEPGVYSSRYEETNEKRIQKVLRNMRDVPENKRTARMICTICCVLTGGREITVRGTCEGKITFEPRGSLSDFGYNPIFETEDGKTFSELSDAQRDMVSHRKQAAMKLVQELKNMEENI